MEKNKKLCDYIILEETTIIDTAKQINKNLKGVVIVVDKENKIIGIITDGDIRRALIRGEDFKNSIKSILGKKDNIYAKPITAQIGTDIDTLQKIMNSNVIKQIPLVDSEDHLVDLLTMEDLLPKVKKDFFGVIMAGGFGRRLGPLTKNVPKPMLKIGGIPLLERIVKQFKKAEINTIYITTHFQSKKIIEYFGNGENFGINIKYVEEKTPLGTAGALCLLPKINMPLIVINGDILSNLDFKAMALFHESKESDITVATREHIVNLRYGIFEIENNLITALKEKPVIKKYINAGIYIIQPNLIKEIPTHCIFDMTDLIQKVISSGGKVVGFPIIEYWIDIGYSNDYRQANEALEDESPDYDVVFQHANAALEIHPQHAFSLFIRAEAYYHLGKDLLALADLNQLLEDASIDVELRADCYELRAFVYEYLDRPSDAEADRKRVQELRPSPAPDHQPAETQPHE